MRKLVVILFIWFIWAAGKDLDALVRFSITTDYYALSNAGLSWLYFLLVGATFLLNASTVYFLSRPGTGGLSVALSALGVAALQNLVTVGFSLSNLSGVREAYAMSRELRGLPVREEAMDLIFTPNAMYVSVAVMLGLYALVAFIAIRARAYFAPPRDDVAEA